MLVSESVQGQVLGASRAFVERALEGD